MPPPAADLASSAPATDMGDSPGEGDMASSPPASGGPTADSLWYASAPVGGVVAVNGSGFVAGDKVQISASGIATVALTTLSLTSTAVAAFVPSVGTPPPADVLVRIARGAGVYPPNGLQLHLTAGKAYYLSPTGSDSATGSYAAPWKTISAAAAKMQPGDVAYLRGGTYSGQVSISVSGTAAAPITFTAFPGESPLLVEPATNGSDLDTVRVLGSYIVLDHLHVTDQNNPGQAIWIGDNAHDVTIQYCEVYGARGQGILISGNGNTVYRSDIHDNGSHPPYDHGIYCDGGNNIIRSNTIHGNFTWGVQVYNGYTSGPVGVGHNLIESNYIWGNGAGSTAASPSSPAGGMVIGNASNNTTVRNNIICGNAQYGIEVIDQEPSNAITGNVSCYNAKGGIYMRYPGAGNTVTGNISYNDAPFALSSTSGVTSDSNYYFSSSGAPQLQWSGKAYSLSGFQSASGQDAHSQVVDAKFKSVPSSGFSTGAASGYNFCTTLNQALCKPLP
ncbi:MAG TPA: right-handed parallel beta-helix repeat-containing protein [Polyangia bacterium]|nr:right-handed parallel beta-helix repeat-containing protein [Polyangia bacterium]